MAEGHFHQLIDVLENAIEGKMFGAPCIKASNGKTAAFLWEGNMVFKLDKQDIEQALMLEGAETGRHLYNPSKEMKGWVILPKEQASEWQEYAIKAINFVSGR